MNLHAYFFILDLITPLYHPLLDRMFANDPDGRGSIPKTQKMILDISLLNAKHYKVRIKLKWSYSRKGAASFPTPQCCSYWKGSPRLRSPTLLLLTTYPHNPYPPTNKKTNIYYHEEEMKMKDYNFLSLFVIWFDMVKISSFWWQNSYLPILRTTWQN